MQIRLVSPQARKSVRAHAVLCALIVLVPEHADIISVGGRSILRALIYSQPSLLPELWEIRIKLLLCWNAFTDRSFQYSDFLESFFMHSVAAAIFRCF